ncbi:hypothetical protein HJFPF1_11209 [Paramyrothecium foliicola]|nr:hypothetical protein HJFPF1_11209 [Paramyrothecium foliicola]
MDRKDVVHPEYYNNPSDMDTSKEAYTPYIEHDPHGTSQPINRNSAHAPEALPGNGLEVFLKDDTQKEFYAPQQSPEVVTAKPLPPPPVPGYETTITGGPHDSEGGSGGKKRGLSRKKIIIIAVVASIIAIIAIVVGAVVGTRNNNSSSSGEQDQSNQTTPTPTTSPPSETSSSTIAVPSEDEVKIGSNFTASFTFYGSGDGGDGTSCKNFGNACGIFPESGYAAGVSQNLYGDGITCGTCWRLYGKVDGGQKALNRTIVVKVNEMCPAEGYPICGQKDLRSVNQFKAQVNFNLCVDTGAADGLFGFNTGVDFATGTVERVDCKEWKGVAKESF